MLAEMCGKRNALHSNAMIIGRATTEGTARYRNRFPQLRDAGHYRQPENVPGAGELWLSSIGLGTYLGEPDDAADAEYTEAIKTALQFGINILDTAINYRHQRSERNIGAALKQLIASGELRRDEVTVCTKAGYLSYDHDLPPDPRAYMMREYIEPGIIDPAQLAGGMHCMAPEFLENQIERSRRNLGLQTIDVFYLHNPESQLSDATREVFHQRLKSAFALLEQEVAGGKIQYYGMATWNAFRVPETSRDYVNLFDVAALAREVGGEEQHFRFVQLPFNLGMPEAYSLRNQESGQGKVSLLDAAAELGIAVVGSATLLQGRLTAGLPEFIGKNLGTANDTESAIQFSCSAPGVATSLIGMGRKEHVAENLKTIGRMRTAEKTWKETFAEKS